MTLSTITAETLARAAQVRLMIFDVDGILTDGSLHFGADGELIKSFNVLDGHGIKLLQQYGITTAIISARQSPIVARRAADLGIAHLHQGIHNKRTAFELLLNECNVRPQHCGFIGDDVIDLPILSRVGFAASVPNAHADVKSRVHYVTTAAGGRGAAREVCDVLLRAQDKYDAMIASYLS